MVITEETERSKFVRNSGRDRCQEPSADMQVIAISIYICSCQTEFTDVDKHVTHFN